MVAIPRGVVAPVLSPRQDLRDWEPPEPKPRRGEFAYCVMFVRIRRKDRWKPAHAASIPPTIYRRACCVWAWVKDAETAASEIVGMNRRALTELKKGRSITLWSVVGFGICGSDHTAEVVSLSTRVHSMEGGVN